jgi:hypothetical protein
MKQNETHLVPKSSDFFECKYCHYLTLRKSQYVRHLSTDKHKNESNETNETKMKQKSSEKFQCFCGKYLNSRTSLWRHKKTCNSKNYDTLEVNSYEPTDKELIMLLIKEHTKIVEQNSEILEVIKNGTNNTNSHNINNSHNKTFNLQFFLNETCKDAMNITDFVDSIKLQLSDLENVGKVGYVEGISNIITTNLKALDVTQRPVHCTDKKREVLYIKDENKWEKEDEDKKRLRKAIKRVASKNQRLLPKFKEAHPDCIKASSLFSDQYNKIIIESMGGSGDNDIEKEDKIIRNITKNATIDKES